MNALPKTLSKEGMPVDTRSWLLYNDGFVPGIFNTLAFAFLWKLVAMLELFHCTKKSTEIAQ